jgi:hypothetical protein
MQRGIREDITMISNRSLSETELDIVCGGMKDIPEQDAANKRRADANGADGTFGGSLGDIVPGLVVKGSGPNTPGHPIDG